MIKLLICDDQVIVCEGLKTILDSDPEIEVIGTVYDGQEALDFVQKNDLDIVLMDLKMPNMNGVIATRKIKEFNSDMPVLILTTYDDDEWLFDAVRSGAAGYLLKDCPPEELIQAIKGTIEGKSFVDPNITGKLLQAVSKKELPEKNHPQFDFNDREKEILQLLAQGLNNADIANQLFLTEGTVRNYTSNIFQKLGVSDRTQAAVAAIRYRLVDLNNL